MYAIRSYYVNETKHHRLSHFVNGIAYNVNQNNDNYKSHYKRNDIQVFGVQIKILNKKIRGDIREFDGSPNSKNQSSQRVITSYSIHYTKLYDNDLAIFAQQLDSLREASGVISFESQVPELTRGYMNALANGRGNSADTKKIEKIYNSFAANGTKLFATEST